MKTRVYGLVFAQEFDQEDYTESNLYDVGTVFQVIRTNLIAPNTVQVLGRGITRLKKRALLVKPKLRWEVQYYNEPKRKARRPALKAYMGISSEIKELLNSTRFSGTGQYGGSQLNYEAPGTDDGRHQQPLVFRQRAAPGIAGDGSSWKAAPNCCC